MIVHLMKLFQSEKEILEGTKNLVIENYDELVLFIIYMHIQFIIYMYIILFIIYMYIV